MFSLIGVCSGATVKRTDDVDTNTKTYSFNSVYQPEIACFDLILSITLLVSAIIIENSGYKALFGALCAIHAVPIVMSVMMFVFDKCQKDVRFSCKQKIVRLTFN